MLKTTIVMNEVIISSGYTPEEIMKIKRFSPETLVVKDDDGNEVFTYSYDVDAHSERPISKFGVTFSTVTNDGKAAGVMQLPEFLETIEEKKQWIAENLGAGLQYASQMEVGFDTKLEEINASINAIVEDIEVIA